jgi:hypothetical protein
MNQKQRSKWEKIRAKGKWRFVMLYGVLCFGMLSFVLGGLFGYFFFQSGFDLKRLLPEVMGFLVMGFFWGWMMWRINENKYRESGDRDS